ARVGLYRPEPLRHVAEGVLDEHGAWQHPGLDEPATLFVVGVTPQAVRFDLELARGEHALALPEGAVVTGRVLVDGAPPEHPVPIAFSQHRSQEYGDSLEFSPFARADRALERLRVRGEPFNGVGDTSTRGLLTDAAGRFVLSGLEAGVDTWLWGPEGWSLAEDSGAQPLAPPAHDVLLRL